jgi:type I restriction enzyme S subunit
MELVNSTLAKVCKLVTDGTHDTPKPVQEGYALIKAKEIVGGVIDFETCDHISRQDHLGVISRSKPEQGDTLFAHIGASLGEAAYVNTSREFSIKNIALFKPDPAVIDGRYLYYLVIGPEFQGTAKAARTGSAQPFLSLGHLRAHPIRYQLDRDVQRRVANILSTYDDLIEVNTRRIVILEEMTRRLFDEWLNEADADEAKAISVPVSQIVTDSLGGDWGVEQPDGDQSELVRVIRGTDIPELTTGNFERCPTRYISSKSFQRRILTPGDVIVENSINAKSRPAGTPFLVTPATLNALDGRAIAASFCRVFKTTSELDAAFLLAEMKRLHRTKDIEKYQVVAVNGIANFQSTRFLARHSVKVPRDNVKRQRLGRLLYDLQTALFSIVIKNLRSTRNLLLPKLISGEIDLSNTERQLKFEADQVAAE